ncbi:DUF7551 domain-containing protein [Natronorubrum halophilum]|uniref:DUF7551 domain-containing protein n=1 Tax=Natronorubrum halophilum TaxID=1702106 RepID=UPI0010C21230|nr:hypothetical protein [Natronorubrum halophilum]
MVGATLGDIRRYIESLASDSGSYYLVCGRTGEHPVPAAGLAFECRSTARAAARATEQYRAALRRYDPRLPFYDVIVCHHIANEATIEDREQPASPVADARDGPATAAHASDDQTVINFCHTVAGAVFETVAESPHDGLEDAIMDTYFEVAETIEGPDELCLRLLESMATEIDTRLEAEEQLDALLAAAQRLPSQPSGGDPLESVLSELESVALLGTYTVDSRSTDSATGTRSWTVTLDEYALGRPGERVVTLPIVLELFRRFPTRELSLVAADSPATRSTSWRMTVTTAPTDSPDGLVRVSELSHP